MGGMLEVLRNAWKIPDLRKKLLVTIALLLVYRIGAHIPVPGLNAEEFAKMFAQGGSLFGFVNIVTGGALRDATIFAMSITPYINSSIIMQLLTVAIPRLEALAKEGEEGRKILGQYVRYGAVILGFLQAAALTWGMQSAIVGGLTIVSFVTITLTFTAGTAFLMWLGEKITEHGIGNGISLIIFTGIVSQAPAAAQTIYANWKVGTFGTNKIIATLIVLLILLAFVAVVAAVIWVSESERRIPVQYAKRVVGRKMYGGQSTHIPIKVNWAGVMPIIFAMSIMMFPSTIIGFINPDSTSGIVNFFKEWPSKISYSVVYALLIMGFTFFYTFIQFNPIELANNLKKNGGFIPGIRPGKPTSDYIAKILNRITWFGGLFLALVTVLPSIIGNLTGVYGLFFGGTSLLILVGVAIDTVREVESMMLMRHYKGFLD